MSFTPVKTNPFAKSGSKSNFNPKSMDHLVDVIEVNAEEQAVYGTNQQGKLCRYTIDAATARKSSSFRQGEVDKHVGFMIDSRMAAAVKPGDKLVMEKAKWASNDKSARGPVSSYTTTWVHSQTVSTPDKIFSAILTAKGNKEGAVVSVQIWDKVAINCADKAAVVAFADRLDANALAAEADRYVPKIGFQFRALRNGTDRQGAPCLECFDSTIPKDSNSESNEEDSKKVFTQVTKDDFITMAKGYTEYLKTTYPDFVSSGCKIEVMSYTTHVVSKHSKDFAPSKFAFDPKAKMISRLSKQSVGDVNGYYGGNVAVRGILAFTDDKVDLKTKTFSARNIVSRIYVNNTLYDARSIIESPAGIRVTTSEAIQASIYDAPSSVPKIEQIMAKVEEDKKLAATGVQDNAIWDEVDPFAE